MEQNRTSVVSSFKVVRKGKRQGVEVTHETQYVDNTGNIVTVESPKQFHAVQPHEDLLQQMRALGPHWANLTERENYSAKQAASAKVIDECEETYPVGSIIWKNGKDYTGIQIHGYKKLATGHAANTLTRLVKFDDDESEGGDKYPLLSELQQISEDLRNEVGLLLNGKHAKPAQQNLLDPDQRVPVNAGEDGDEG